MSSFESLPARMDICHTFLSVEQVPMRTLPYVLHAESNAILKCAKYGRPTNSSTLYITHSPCIECAKLIIQAGIIRVVYLEDYRKAEGLELLKRVGINVEKFES